jgi:hypothetical protein
VPPLVGAGVELPAVQRPIAKASDTRVVAAIAMTMIANVREIRLDSEPSGQVAVVLVMVTPWFGVPPQWRRLVNHAGGARTHTSARLPSFRWAATHLSPDRRDGLRIAVETPLRPARGRTTGRCERVSR